MSQLRNKSIMDTSAKVGLAIEDIRSEIAYERVKLIPSQDLNTGIILKISNTVHAHIGRGVRVPIIHEIKATLREWDYGML